MQRTKLTKLMMSLALVLTLSVGLVLPTMTRAEYPEHMEITVAQWDSGNWEQTDKDVWLKELGEKFNVTFKKVVITWDDWQEKTRLWAAGGQLPDLFVHDENYMEWVNQGLFKGIPVEVLDRYPNVKNTIMPDVLEVLTVDGKIYSIPKSHFNDAAKATALGAIFVRKDFLEKAGLSQPPQTVDEWYDFLKKAVDEDFSGTGSTIGLKAASLITRLPFVKSSGAWIQEDGKWIPNVFSKTHIEELEFVRKLYKEGILDPDFSIRKVFDERTLFQQGKMAVIEANGDPGMLSQQVTSDMVNTKASDFIVLSLPPMADDGNRYFYHTLNYWSYSAMAPQVSDEKMERILAVMDYLCTPEGQLLAIFGKEGVDYRSKDGQPITSPAQSDNIESLLPVDPGSNKQLTLQEVYPSSWFGNCFPSWNTWANLINPVFPVELRQTSNDYFASVIDQTTILPPNLDIMFMSSPEKNRMPDLESLYGELFVELVMNDEPIEAAFNGWVEELSSQYAAAIEEVNNNMK